MVPTEPPKYLVWVSNIRSHLRSENAFARFIYKQGIPMESSQWRFHIEP